LLDIFTTTTFLSPLEFRKKHNLSNKPIIALLPGSREAEIKENLNIIQSISVNYTDYQFVVAGMSHFTSEFYSKFITDNSIKVIFSDTYNLVKNSVAAIVVSGTATLETALLSVPQVIVYQTNKLTYIVGKLVLKLPYIGLPNIIMGKHIVKELIQHDLNSQTLSLELNNLLYNDDYIAEIKKNYTILHELLGKQGAFEKLAYKIFNYLQKK
ncbi:MAG: lipid-A-disaccharide synthase, partial [Bacteroidales bacterium]